MVLFKIESERNQPFFLLDVTESRILQHLSLHARRFSYYVPVLRHNELAYHIVE